MKWAALAVLIVSAALGAVSSVVGQADPRGIGETVVLDPDRLQEGCVVQALKGCSSPMGGYLRNGQHLLHWQLQEGFTDEDGIRGGIVLLGDAGAARIGPIKPIGWSFDAARFDAPVLFHEGEADYVAVPGVHAGSGMGSADVLFRWTPDGPRVLTPIDAESWRDALQAQLPEGLTPRSARIDWHEMFVAMPLARDSDGGCCATGGTALVSLAVEGDRLVVANLQLRTVGG